MTVNVTNSLGAVCAYLHCESYGGEAGMWAIIAFFTAVTMCGISAIVAYCCYKYRGGRSCLNIRNQCACCIGYTGLDSSQRCFCCEKTNTRTLKRKDSESYSEDIEPVNGLRRQDRLFGTLGRIHRFEVIDTPLARTQFTRFSSLSSYKPRIYT